jgi:coenzyme F420 hydrogenase subunit delta
MSKDVVPEYAAKRVLVLGVGNVFFGDDGFGPAAADYLQKNCKIPDDVYVIDVGIGAGDILFNVALSATKPQMIIILDSVDMKRKPGEVFQLSLEELPADRMSEFSMHFFPSPNVLKELRDQMDIKVIIVACQAERMPDSISPGLSETVQKALPKAAETVLELARRTRLRGKTD